MNDLGESATSQELVLCPNHQKRLIAREVSITVNNCEGASFEIGGGCFTLDGYASQNYFSCSEELMHVKNEGPSAITVGWTGPFEIAREAVIEVP